MQRVVEPVFHILPAAYLLLVVIYIAVLPALEDGVLFVLLQAAVVVGLVHRQPSYKPVQRRHHHVVGVRIVELRHVEEQRVHLRHVEAELLVAEITVGDEHYEAPHVDAAVEVYRAVLAHGYVAAARIHHHTLAVAHHKLLHTTHLYQLAVYIHPRVVVLGVTLYAQRVVVVSLGARHGFHVVLQLLLHHHRARHLVVCHQAMLRQPVYHQHRLPHVEPYVRREFAYAEVIVITTKVIVHPLDWAHLVYALYLARLTVGVVVAALKHRRAASHVTQVRELKLCAVGLPGDDVAVYVQLVIRVGVGTVEVALRVVDEAHLVVSRRVAHRDAGVGYRVGVTHIEGHCRILAHYTLRRDGELLRRNTQLTLAATLEYKARRMLAARGNELRAVHHEAAAVVHIGHYVRYHKVTLVAAEARIAVLTGLHGGAQRLLHTPHDGLAEVVRVHQPRRVGSELGELGLRLVARQLGIAGFGSEARAAPVNAATLAAPQLFFVVVASRGAMYGAAVLGRRVEKVGGRVEPHRRHTVAHLYAERRLGVEAPLARLAPVEHTLGKQPLAEVHPLHHRLHFRGLLLHCLHHLQPAVEVLPTARRGGVGRQRTHQGAHLGVALHLGLHTVVHHRRHTLLHPLVHGAVRGTESLHRLGVLALLVAVRRALVHPLQQLVGQPRRAELRSLFGLLCHHRHRQCQQR